MFIEYVANKNIYFGNQIRQNRPNVMIDTCATLWSRERSNGVVLMGTLCVLSKTFVCVYLPPKSESVAQKDKNGNAKNISSRNLLNKRPIFSP